MAMAAAPYLHPKLSAVELKPNERETGLNAEDVGIRVEFVQPPPRDD
jgi:hypothetical protein